MNSLRMRVFLGIFWLASAVTVAVLAWQGPAWWDTDVYWTAARSVADGGDPYAEGMAAQVAFHATNTDPKAKPPMTYVYSPMTLPVLRVVGRLPAGLLAGLYYAALAGGFLLQLWAGLRMALPEERKVVLFLLPAAAFFPGLLNDDVLLSGNVVYLLYGLILAAAVLGWERNRWGWYYAAVLLASCCKAPLLSLLALPVAVGTRQLWKAVAAGLAGVCLFLGQAWVWPGLFGEYLKAVNLQFVLNDDFGFSPAGLAGSALWHAGLPYTSVCQGIYLVFALSIAAVLWRTRQYLGAAAATRLPWLPVALVGTILLNPRVKEYDVAALTIPMCLIAWRGARAARRAFEERRQQRRPFLAWDAGAWDADAGQTARGAETAGSAWAGVATAAALAGWFVAANVAAGSGLWKPLELVLLLLLFLAGTWAAVSRARQSRMAGVPETLAEYGWVAEERPVTGRAW